ncbi:hypothetical protein MNBD_GAMMA18-1924 [hydrothermal vent metagenome]|uniref:Uncharacterized protein n=1 Tax=hydrothermal vent metagenome TaxID=652676 RepID=A0A3B0Z7M0_9ZZZZ
MALNMSDSFIVRLGFEANYLLVAGVSLLIASLAMNQHILIVVVVLVLALGAGVPEGTAENIGYDRDVILAALVAVIVLPLIRDFFDLE